MALPSGAWLIDTPGMREFGLLGAEAGLSETFDDISALATDCRFRDCSHMVEDGCALLEAIASGELDQARYDRYMKSGSVNTTPEPAVAIRREGANLAPTGVVLTSSNTATLRFVRLGGHHIGLRQRAQA